MKKAVVEIAILFLILLAVSIVFGAAPSITSVTLNSTDKSNETTKNITCYQIGGSDGDSHNITYMKSWYKDGVLNATTNPFQISSSDLVLYLPMDNDGYDYSINNNATLSGVSATASGRIDGAYSFDGINDFINMSSLTTEIVGMESATFATWFKIPFDYSSSSSATHVFWQLYEDNNNRPEIASFTPADGKIRFRMFIGGAAKDISSDSTSWNADQWYHLAVACGDGGMKMYIDGVKQSATNSTNNCFGNLSNLVWNGMGNNFYNSAFTTSWMNGTLDEVMFWNISLTDAQVASIYFGGRSGGNIMNSDYTRSGQNHICEITPIDYLETGTAVNSSSFLVSYSDIDTSLSISGKSLNYSSWKVGAFVIDLINTNITSNTDVALANGGKITLNSSCLIT